MAFQTVLYINRGYKVVPVKKIRNGFLECTEKVFIRDIWINRVII